VHACLRPEASDAVQLSTAPGCLESGGCCQVVGATGAVHRVAAEDIIALAKFSVALESADATAATRFRGAGSAHLHQLG
jgi:hypothetical protein